MGSIYKIHGLSVNANKLPNKFERTNITVLIRCTTPVVWSRFRATNNSLQIKFQLTKNSKLKVCSS